MNVSNRESGFTLIELLTVVGIIGVLSSLGITSFYVYRSDAAYAVAERLVSDGRQSVEATLSAVDENHPTVSNYVQSTQGPISDATAAKVLIGMNLPRKTKIEFSFDPACDDSGCVMASIQANHCQSNEHIKWIRYGDGIDIRLEHLAGGGCS